MMLLNQADIHITVQKKASSGKNDTLQKARFQAEMLAGAPIVVYLMRSIYHLANIELRTAPKALGKR